MRAALIISIVTAIAAVPQLEGRPSAVAFSVRTKRGLPVSTVANTICFDEVLLNMGGGYNPASGVFVVPVAGMYLFTVNIRASDGYQGGWVHLMKNNKELAYVYDNYTGGNSNQVLVRAVRGDHVFARQMPHYSLWDGGLHAYTSMSGILLIPG